LLKSIFGLKFMGITTPQIFPNFFGVFSQEFGVCILVFIWD